MNLAPEHYLLIALNLGMAVLILWPEPTVAREVERARKAYGRGHRA